MYEDWLNPPEDPEPVHCPVCDQECDEIYFNRDGDVIGCDMCISTQSAADWAVERDENARAEMEDRKYDEYRDRMLFDDPDPQ